MTQPEWDDERLEAAFHQMFDRPAPPDLEKAIHVRIAGTTPARLGAFRRSGAGWALAAAAVVAVLVGTLTVGLGGFGRTAGSPAPSASDVQATPGASATPTEQAVPGAIFGLPVIHVSDALAIRDAGVDDRELAVQGWFEGGIQPGCPAPATNPVNPLQVECPDGFVWFMERPESLIHRSGNLTSGGGPSGPALNPDLDGIDRSWQPAGPSLDAKGDSTPIDVVFVGHFDDRRAASCPAAEQTACRDRFVVDSVAMARGDSTKADRVSPTDATTQSTSFDIEQVVANEAPDSTVLSMTIVDGPTDLATFEPTLKDGQQGLIHQPILWIARVLESGRITTYIVVDGSDAIYEMNPEGQAILVGGTPPTSSASPSSSAAWPPAGARVIALTSEVGAGEPPVRVAVVDQSGRLQSVSEKGAVDPSAVSFDGRFGAYAEPGIQGRVHLTWVGGICDSQITVTVSRDIDSISFDMGPQPDCDSIGIGRQLVLDFAGSVDVAAIELSEAVGTTPIPTPAPSDGLGYTLDCGPLGPDTCASKAADVIGAAPPRLVVSIAFSDECGSNTVVYTNGTVTTASVDSIILPSPS